MNSSAGVRIKKMIVKLGRGRLSDEKAGAKD